MLSPDLMPKVRRRRSMMKVADVNGCPVLLAPPPQAEPEGAQSSQKGRFKAYLNTN